MRVSSFLQVLCAAVLISLLGAVSNANAIPVIYSSRATFEAQLGSKVIDDYSNPSYAFTQSNAQMSAVRGETKYQSTGFSDLNIVSNQHYCAGCNGSYLLDFTATSVGTANGVFGVGLDVVSDEGVFGTTAFVSFGDGTTANYSIPVANLNTGDAFWGITSDSLIRTIHFGLIDGGTSTSGSVQRMAQDNLTIGDRGTPSVPEPSTLALFAAGVAGLRLRRRTR